MNSNFRLGSFTEVICCSDRPVFLRTGAWCKADKSLHHVNRLAWLDSNLSLLWLGARSPVLICRDWKTGKEWRKYFDNLPRWAGCRWTLHFDDEQRKPVLSDCQRFDAAPDSAACGRMARKIIWALEALGYQVESGEFVDADKATVSQAVSMLGFAEHFGCSERTLKALCRLSMALDKQAKP